MSVLQPFIHELFNENVWMSLPWFVCLFIDYIQCGWLPIQLGGRGQAHLGLFACSLTTFSVGGSQYNWVVVDKLTLVCMLVHGLHSVWVALNTTGWMWTSSPWFVWLFIDYIQCG